MPVKSIALQDFSAFGDVRLEFVPGINVFIGENATGKSHLMKLIYSVAHTLGSVRPQSPDANTLSVKLKEKLIGVYRPADDQVGRLVRRARGRKKSTIELKLDKQSLAFSVTTVGNVAVGSIPTRFSDETVFIPSREALALYEGFIHAYEKRELSIDETYYDLCVALSGRSLRGPREAAAKELVAPLERVLGGSVVLKDGRFSVKSKDGNLEAHLLAEGLRKIAGIVHLVLNGSLGNKSILLWDEPEANLNPRLITKVADALRSLAAEGMQIFLSTHDYLLTQELSLAVDYKTSPAVPTRFFCLYRPEAGKPVSVSSGDTLADLTPNPIVEEFIEHYERERRLAVRVGEG